MQNKWVINVLLVIIMILVIVACVITYMCFINDVEIIEQPKEEYLFSLENYPRVDGSIEMVPLAESFKSYLTGTDINDVEISHSKTHNAYVNLINDNTDLILVTHPTESELKIAESQGIELEIKPIAKDAFVFWVNELNSVEDITKTQIQDIYSGKIKNWKDIGGNNNEILAFQRPNGSTNQTTMTNFLMKGIKLKNPIVETFDYETKEIVDIVSDYNNDVNAIGYSYLYYLKNMYITDNIRTLSINGIKPTYENIQTGLYDMQTTYYAIIRRDESEESSARKLLNYMISAEGQKIVKEAGYVQNY